MFRDITSLGGYAVVTLITFAVIGYLFMDGKRGAALWVLASVGGGAVLSSLAQARDRASAARSRRPSGGGEYREFPKRSCHACCRDLSHLGALLSRVEARSSCQDLRLDGRSGPDFLDRR